MTTQRITVGFAASSSEEAHARAVEWARNEPKLRLRTVCRVAHPVPPSQMYLVELAVVHIDGADITDSAGARA